MDARTVAESRTIFSQMMLPDDANPLGNVHGGTIAKLVDSAGAVAAMRHCRGHVASVVTARIDAMNFVQPVHIGEVVTLRASVNDVGRTSLEVGVRVEAENVRTADIKHVASAYLVYVALDDAGQPAPVPPLIVETDDERRRQDAARARRAGAPTEDNVHAYDLIAKKRDGGTHTVAEIEWLLAGFVAGRVPNYQMAAWLMAVYLRGLDEAETLALTMAMTASGQVIDLAGLPRPVVDKHSTGGVGDKTTLVLAPLVAACGLPVAKMSGRGLGHTGGTLDKLEAIPGVRADLSPGEFREQVRRIGVAVTAQSAEVVPADRLLYALRDVTATVDSLPLIASSVMCKKLACGADAIVLDVKTGGGAFMRETRQAIELAQAMVTIGRGAGRRMAALVTDMDGPLGHAVGNALEVHEAIDTLRGQGPRDLAELCVTLAAHMLVLGDKAATPAEGAQAARGALQNGSGLRAFQQLVAAQGGPDGFEGAGLPTAPRQVDVPAPSGGRVQRVDAFALGVLARDLGAGRATKEDVIDPAVGLVIHRKAGDAVRRGQALATLHLSRDEGRDEWAARCASAFAIGAGIPEPRPLVHAVV